MKDETEIMGAVKIIMNRFDLIMISDYMDERQGFEDQSSVTELH